MHSHLAMPLSVTPMLQTHQSHQQRASRTVAKRHKVNLSRNHRDARSCDNLANESFDSDFGGSHQGSSIHGHHQHHVHQQSFSSSNEQAYGVSAVPAYAKVSLDKLRVNANEAGDGLVGVHGAHSSRSLARALDDQQQHSIRQGYASTNVGQGGDGGAAASNEYQDGGYASVSSQYMFSSANSKKSGGVAPPTGYAHFQQRSSSAHRMSPGSGRVRPVDGGSPYLAGSRISRQPIRLTDSYEYSQIRNNASGGEGYHSGSESGGFRSTFQPSRQSRESSLTNSAFGQGGESAPFLSSANNNLEVGMGGLESSHLVADVNNALAAGRNENEGVTRFDYVTSNSTFSSSQSKSVQIMKSSFTSQSSGSEQQVSLANNNPVFNTALVRSTISANSANDEYLGDSDPESYLSHSGSEAEKSGKVHRRRFDQQSDVILN